MLCRNTVILKLNHRRSKHWNWFLKHSNGSLWTKLSGILVFAVVSSLYCIARTLMGWLNLNYGEYWSVTSTNKMNKANQFVTYLILKNFRPLFPGTLRVGFAKQLRPTSNVCNSFWEEQIQSFISKNQFNCLLVTFIVLTT